MTSIIPFSRASSLLWSVWVLANEKRPPPVLSSRTAKVKIKVTK